MAVDFADAGRICQVKLSTLDALGAALGRIWRTTDGTVRGNGQAVHHDCGIGHGYRPHHQRVRLVVRSAGDLETVLHHRLAVYVSLFDYSYLRFHPGCARFFPLDGG